jgi:hypothetical protein
VEDARREEAVVKERVVEEHACKSSSAEISMKSFLLSILFPCTLLFSQQRSVDYRFAPDYWHTTIGFPDDWQKTMVNEKGFLLLDFGPGPYVRPNTVIGVSIPGADLAMKSQRLENANTPVVLTELAGQGSSVLIETFALVQEESHSTAAKKLPGVRRKLGLTGGIAWAHPPDGTDPVFRNVAWGTNRPILYEFTVRPTERKRLALGICESYRTVPGLRMMEFHIEGAEVRTVDPIAEGERNQPVVTFFDAQDVNGDGILSVEVRASAECRDPNVILNGIWMFPAQTDVSAQEVMDGRARRKAELVVDCGAEPEVQNFPTRIDGMLVTTTETSGPLVLTVQTTRKLEFDSRRGVLTHEGRPFVVSRPRASMANETERGWELVFSRDVRKIEAIAVHGYRLPKDIVMVPHLAAERRRSVEWWKNSGLPAGRIELPDAELQHLFDASVRVLYQNRDIVDGEPNFQPGSTVYRGLWIHDGIYYIEAAAILGDTAGARRATERLFSFQQPDGRIRVMYPIEMQRETPMLAWIMNRYARIADNRPWLRAHWSRVVAAMNVVRSAREQTLKDPSKPYYGLMPPGFVDGGIAGLTADYSSVYWAIIGLESAIEMAAWIGESAREKEWRSLHSEFLQSFRLAARRDMRRDRHGNLYLPVRVADTTTTDAPQRAQWAICEAVMLSSMFPPDDPLVTGSLALLDSSCVQGLPATLGWMDGGIGVWFAPLYGLAHFVRGNTDRAIDVLYAFANHATPHGSWAEEQMPKGVSSRTTGDYPTTSATACMLRSVIYLLALEQGNVLDVFKGVPVSWLKPGASVRIHDLLTRFGSVSATATVAVDGRTAALSVSSRAHGDADDAMAQYTDKTNVIRLSLAAFKKAGFKNKDGSSLPDFIQSPWNQKIFLEVRK